MPEGAARAYLRDLPEAELQLIPGAGHWLLETHFELALPIVQRFLERAFAR
jgi:pimeloyl-ACP methyl ester carboxylesterase